MKIHRDNNKGLGFTVTDLVLVVAAVIVVGIVLPWSSRFGRRNDEHARGRCYSNIRQVALAFRIWSNDHEEKFPWQVPLAQGGSQEYLETGQVFRHFLAASNEMYSPKMLACRSDASRSPTTNWSKFSNANLSYFVGVDANETIAASILSGDRSLSENGRMESGQLTISTNTEMTWAPGLHEHFGFIALGDGSAQIYEQRNLTRRLQKEARLPARILIP